MSETTGRTTDGTMLIRDRRLEYQWLRDADGEQLYGFIVSQADIAAIEQAAIHAALVELRTTVEGNPIIGKVCGAEMRRLIDDRLA